MKTRFLEMKNGNTELSYGLELSASGYNSPAAAAQAIYRLLRDRFICHWDEIEGDGNISDLPTPTAPAPEGQLTIENVTNRAQLLVAKVGLLEAKGILSQYGVRKVQDIPTEKWKEFIDLVDAKLQEEK